MQDRLYWLVAIPRGSHPIPFRIRSLSPSGPMVVIPQGIVRVGRCQPLFSTDTAARLELPFSFSMGAGCGSDGTRASVPISPACKSALDKMPRSSPQSSECDTMPARHFDVPLIPSLATRTLEISMRQLITRSAAPRCAAVGRKEV